ncbi:hypothetical protein CSC02_4477 [Enterobacter hormaechei subsp. hoffmannii]|nr:hypothetical protein CSC02_4477 [Enterobacter hormaechei subsp. hoffmannii]
MENRLINNQPIFHEFFDIYEACREFSNILILLTNYIL